jgi:outer membrane protein OmpA-like peptidoglycan-associated protein
MIYTPFKIAYAALGSGFGGLAWAYSGGSQEVAESVIGAAVYGDWVITPDHLRHPETIEFVGRWPSEGASRVTLGSASDPLAPVSAALPVRPHCADLLELPTVRFELAQSRLTLSTVSTLDYVARRLRECPSLRVDLEAHADATGPAASNQVLSERRAEAVMRHLVSVGVDASRIAWIGYGEERPTATNGTAGGRALNRRVELPIR